MTKIRFVSYGLGYIGRVIAKVALERGLEMVGGIDVDPRLVGNDLSTLLGSDAVAGLRVSTEPERILSETAPDIVFHATSSFLEKVFGEIMLGVNAGASVISTCETLCYPYYRYPNLAEQIDRASKAKGVNVLGTGINPGFVMDTLPAVITTCIARLDRLSVTRFLDASKRRPSFQRKIGLGLTPQEFNNMLSMGKITSHVGLSESVLLISSMLGLKIDEVREEQTPILAEEKVELNSTVIERGRVSGVAAIGIGSCEGKETIRLKFVALAGIRDQEYEEIRVEGVPSVTWRSSGTAGDLATGAVVVNTAIRLHNLRPGLLTMKDLVQTAYCHLPKP